MPVMLWIRAVEGLSGATTLYTLFGVLFTLCLGGILFFALVAMVLNFCFIAAMITIAIMARGGAQHYVGNVTTPLGDGPFNLNAVSYGHNGFALSGHNLTFQTWILRVVWRRLSSLSPSLRRKFSPE
jgi:hypothetical protein